jgi:hypothetical protein
MERLEGEQREPEASDASGRRQVLAKRPPASKEDRHGRCCCLGTAHGIL